MPITRLIFLAWVLCVSAYARGWQPTHTWLPGVCFWLGVVYVALELIIWVSGQEPVLKSPFRHSRPNPET